MSTAPMRTGLCFGLAAVVFAATAGAGAPTGAPPRAAHGAKATASAAPTASAAATVAATAAPVDDVAAWFAKGTAAHEAGRFAEAEELFLKVWAVKKAWDVAANLGFAQVNLGKHVEAAEHLSYALEWFPASEPATTKSVLERRLATARAEIGAVKVTVNVAGATVRANGISKGASPLDGEVFVAPGSVTIEVEKDGYEAVRKTLDVAKGGSGEAALTLVPKTAPERSKLPAYVIGGVGIAGVLAGAVLIGVAEGQKADLAAKLPHDASGNLVCARTAPDTNPQCTGLRSQATQLDAFGNAGIATLAIGGAAIAGAALYYFWPQPKDSPSKTGQRVVPFAGREGGGMVWTGSF